MKKLTRLAVIVAMVLMVVTPAVAQGSLDGVTQIEIGGVELGTETQVESGGIELGGEVANEGNYAGQCTPATQFGNTVSPQSHLDAFQFASELDDIEFDGSVNLLQYASKIGDVEGDSTPMTFEPTQEVSCERSVQQATGAG